MHVKHVFLCLGMSDMSELAQDLIKFSQDMKRFDPDGVHGDLESMLTQGMGKEASSAFSQIFRLSQKIAEEEEKDNRVSKWAWYSEEMFKRLTARGKTLPRYQLKNGKIVTVTIISNGLLPRDPYEGRIPDVACLGEIEKLVSLGSG